jgi:hypothetical protein
MGSLRHSHAQRRHRAMLLPEVKRGDEVEEDRAESNYAGDDAEPRKYESAVVAAGRRRGNAEDEVQTTE